jgi:AhpD family alkylhydroperoxidase
MTPTNLPTLEIALPCRRVQIRASRSQYLQIFKFRGSPDTLWKWDGLYTPDQSASALFIAALFRHNEPNFTCDSPQTQASLKEIMVQPSTLDPLVKDLIYIAVSTANGCNYCVHSHTAAAKAKGMTEAQHADLLAVIGIAAQTNALANALQLPVDPQFMMTR